MPFEPFYEKFRDLAVKETRTITTQNNLNLPDDDYGFLEAFCNDKDCDCRRVMFNVVSKNQKKIVAVIAYGWESQAFYARWYRQNDEEIIRDMQGPILNLGSEQSNLAPALLELARNHLLSNPSFVERLKRHYLIFKERVDPAHFRPAQNTPTKRQIVSSTRKRHLPRSIG